jgi:hypothetical protein
MRPSFALLLALPALGCRPDLGDPASLIAGPRLLAVRGDPPEAAPGAAVSYSVLAVSAEGTMAAPPILWAFCAAANPLTDDDSVSPACLHDAVVPIGGPSPTAQAPTPLDACSLFGPDPPPGSFRPHDPDSTGGFYQPVRAQLDALTAFRLQRVPCDLPDAPASAAIELSQRYRPNQNPSLAQLTASVAGSPVSLDAIPAGATVQLSTGWGQGDAETYVMFDPGSTSVVERREALSVSWFATGGTFTAEVTGSAEDDPATTTQTTWLAPASPGAIQLWVVLRDSRGGVDFAAHDLGIR